MESVHTAISMICGFVIGYCLESGWRWVAGFTAACVLAVNFKYWL